MLTKFRVNNFRNLINIEFLPARVNVIIGPNNAGKTNLSSALRFASLSASLPLDEAAGTVLGENWNLTNAYLAEKLMTFEVGMSLPEAGAIWHYTYQLELSAEREPVGGKQALRVVREKLEASADSREPVTLLENLNGAAKVRDEKAPAGDAPVFLEARVPANATALSKLFDSETNRHALRFKGQLANLWYFNVAPQALRSPKVFGKGNLINSDGTNLNKLLFSLHNENPRLERRVIEALKLVEPKIDLFRFHNPDPEFILFMFEDAAGRPFSPQSMSDGTLRYLLLATLFILLDEWARVGRPAPLIIFEEPENGLYVGALKPLLARLDFGAAAGQFLFTSHNPYFIDLFDAHPECVHVMKPGVPSPVLARPDPARLRELLGEMPLGDLHFRGLLA